MTASAKLSDQAAGLFSLMGDGMRLIVPVGDMGIRLVADPRIPYLAGEPPLDVPKAPVIELIRAGLISAMDENGWDPDNPQAPSGPNRTVVGGRLGWRQMFKGHLDLIPEGAQVYAISQ